MGPNPDRAPTRIRRAGGGRQGGRAAGARAGGRGGLLRLGRLLLHTSYAKAQHNTAQRRAMLGIINDLSILAQHSTAVGKAWNSQRIFHTFDISNKILGENVKELIHEQIISNYSTPGLILNLLNFANTNGVDLTQMNLKDFIKMIISEKKYKKDYFIKHLLYSLIELYFRQNVSIKNIRLLKIQNYFLKKINYTKIFNLDDETILMEFEERVLNG